MGFYISWLSSGLEQVSCFDKMILCGFLKTLRACGVADCGVESYGGQDSPRELFRGGGQARSILVVSLSGF